MTIQQIIGLKSFSNYLVEDCSRLRLSDLSELPEMIEQSKLKASDKLIMLKSGRNAIQFRPLSYSLVSLEPQRISLSLGLGNNNWAAQEILLTKVKANFGIRLSFVCDCGQKINCLYFRCDVKKWACRSCLSLVYELTRIKRDSLMGELEYRLSRWMKVSEIEGEVKTLFYNGKPTQKLLRFVRLKQKWLGGDTVKALQAKSLNI
jgi:hypothetical protein